MSAVAFSFSSRSFCLPSFLGVCLISLVLKIRIVATYLPPLPIAKH